MCPHRTQSEGMCRVECQPHERIDDLQIGGLRLIQNPKWFCFGVDAVLLSHFLSLKAGDVAVELGTGNGIVSILASVKYEFHRIFACELQPAVADLARRSVQLNGLGDRIEILEMDMLALPDRLSASSIDVVFSNPPYVSKGRGIVSERSEKALSRHETTAGVAEILELAAYLLKPGGALYLVHRPDRLVDIFCAARACGIEPKRIRFVHPSCGKKPNIVLIALVKGAGRELKYDDPLYVYDEAGNYSKEIHEIYGREYVDPVRDTDRPSR